MRGEVVVMMLVMVMMVMVVMVGLSLCCCRPASSGRERIIYIWAS